MSELRERILKAIGEREPFTSLDLRVLSEEDMGDYVRQKISYLVTDRERVNAYLLLPKNLKGKRPAMVAIHQHAVWFSRGKLEQVGLDGDPDFFYGVDLVRRGYVVICPELMCFGERRYGKYFEPEYNRSCEFEKIVGQYLLADGRTMTGKYLYDNVAAVDVLCSLDCVDADRIGVMGHSTGGQSALWLAWYDRRIKACVSSCGFALVKDLREKNVGHNLAMCFPGMKEICDYDDLCREIAPRALCFTCGNFDPTFLMYSCRKIAGSVSEAYAAAGAADRFEAIFFEGWHWLKPAVKTRVYSFLERNL